MAAAIFRRDYMGHNEKHSCSYMVYPIRMAFGKLLADQKDNFLALSRAL
jgi:hypothetical protein